MNIYELNALIENLETRKDGMGKDMIPFYYEQRKKLLKEISKGINEILKS